MKHARLYCGGARAVQGLRPGRLAVTQDHAPGATAPGLPVGWVASGRPAGLNQAAGLTSLWRQIRPGSHHDYPAAADRHTCRFARLEFSQDTILAGGWRASQGQTRSQPSSSGCTSGWGCRAVDSLRPV